MHINREEAQHVFDYVMQRAATDPAFRKGLLRDPRATLQQEFDVALPDQFNIRFIENQGADLTIVLPDFVGPSGELSDRDLDAVAGGARHDVRDAFTCHLGSAVFDRPK